MIQIGARVFFTKDAALKKVRDVRDRIWKTKQVSDDDHVFLVGLLELHPRAAQKVGTGVKTFEVRSFAGGLHFLVVRVDGSQTDFSFLKCFNTPSHEQQVKRALSWVRWPSASAGAGLASSLIPRISKLLSATLDSSASGPMPPPSSS